MNLTLPATTDDLMRLTWKDLEPYILELEATPLTPANLDEWLAEWTRLSELVGEQYARMYVATTVNTVDEAAGDRFKRFLDETFPPSMEHEQILKEKLLASNLVPAGFEIPLRNMRTEAEIFRAVNLPLQAEEQKLTMEYDQLVGAQTVQWEGQEVTVTQLQPVYRDPDRAKREQAWRLALSRQLADRTRYNDLWARLLDLRLQMAKNAGFPDYRAYRWKTYLRFDYTPADCRAFHDAIEKAVVPAQQRIYARRKARLGVDTLRPWDLSVDPANRQPLKPFGEVDELIHGGQSIFHRVDPQIGAYFDTMIEKGLLDLDNRKNKGPGAFCSYYASVRLPFIFENAVGLHDDVQVLLHEGGHAFHCFETRSLPYYQQLTIPMEFAEVASMGMELLASPYLAKEAGGFYSPAQAARARIEHLESLILFWPYMAVVDAFQHWVYENPTHAANPAACDSAWGELWSRFMPGVDWTGLEAYHVTGWHRKMHIFEMPFYYVEYGLAQLGSVLVWRNSLRDQAGAVQNYRKALSLGGTVSLPELFRTAGARLAFDASTLQEAVDLIETTISGLESQQ